DAIAERGEMAHGGIARVKPELAQFAGIEIAIVPPLHVLGEAVERVEGETERLSNVAHGALAAVRNDLGGEGGAVAAVLAVEVLDDFLAALVFEVDVDIRRFVALLADESFEEQVAAVRVDGGDTKTEANGGVGGRAAALAKNVSLLGEPDDVLHRE